MARSSKLTPFHDLIGTVPDREVAVMADVAIATVHHYRKRHDIPSFRSTIATEAPTPTAAPEPAQPAPTAPTAPTAATTLQGFAVTLDLPGGLVERFLIAESVVVAAQRGMVAGPVVKVTHLGRALV